MNLKSKLFQRVDQSHIESLAADCTAVASLNSDELADVCAQIPNLITASKGKLEKRLKDLDDKIRKRSLPVARFLLWYSEWTSERDADDHEVDDLEVKLQVEDMVSLELIVASQITQWLNILGTASSLSVSSNLKKARAQKAAEDGVVPRLVDAYITADLRAVLNDDSSIPSWGLSFVPICSLQLELDGGEPRRHYLQMTIADVNELIEKLQKASSVLEELSKRGREISQ